MNRNAVRLILGMIDRMCEGWHMTYKELAAFSKKYHIFELLYEGEEYYESIGEEGVFNDLEQMIIKQGGQLP